MNNNVNYAGFWIRVVAALVDTLWLSPLVFLFMYLAMGSNMLSIDNPSSTLDSAIAQIIWVVVVVALWIKFASTPGKMLFGMKIVDAKTHDEVPAPRLLLRYIGYFISMIPLFLGIIWVGIDKKKQGWHDKIAGTVVIRK